MSRTLLLSFVAAVSAGCADATAPAAFSGTIAARSFGGATLPQTGSVLVAAGSSCEQQIVFSVGVATRLVRTDGRTVTADSLTLGRDVVVHYSGAGAMSCPPSFGADVVILE
jgi:hypothetical protein